jgi:hypothetical protein
MQLATLFSDWLELQSHLQERFHPFFKIRGSFVRHVAHNLGNRVDGLILLGKASSIALQKLF